MTAAAKSLMDFCEALYSAAVNGPPSSERLDRRFKLLLLSQSAFGG